MPYSVNTRALLIAAGLVLPVVVLGYLTIHAKERAASVTVAPANAIENARRALEAEKAKHHARLAEIEKMTDAQWALDKIKNPHHAPTREEGIAGQKAMIARLDHMTSEQWLAIYQQQQRQWQQRQREWQEWRKTHPLVRTVPKKPLPAVNR